MSSLLYFLRQYRRPYFWLTVTLVAAAVTEALSVAGMYPLLRLAVGDAAGGDQTGRVLETMLAIFDRVPPDKRMLAALVLYLVTLTANTALQLLREWRTSTTSGFVAYDVKQRVFRRYVDAPYAFFLSANPGDLTYRLSTAPANLSFCLYLGSAVLNSALTAVLVATVLVSVEWRITLVIGVVGVGVFLANRAVANNVSAWTGRGKQAAASLELDIVQEFVAGNKEIRVAGVGDVWAGRFQQQGATYRGHYVRDLLWAAVPSSVSELVVFAIIGALVVSAAGSNVGAVRDMLPVMAVFYYGIRQLLSSTSALGRQALRMAGLLPDVELLRRALVEPYADVRPGTLPQVPDWQTLRFDQVSMTYAQRDVAALDGVSLTVPRGSVVALVGASGSGKTSMVNLLLRLFDPTDGAIRVDETRIDDILRASWLDTIGYVSQENFIFNASISDNIRFGGHWSAAEVHAAATAAFADEFIRELPDGYDTVVGAHGMTLSGGQRQRLAIARALVRRPRLLILDEATSALDARSEALVQQALQGMRGHCTQVIVAHRLSTVRDADNIVVMESGRIVETGRHDDLMTRGGVYASLYRRQQTEQVGVA